MRGKWWRQKTARWQMLTDNCRRGVAMRWLGAMLSSQVRVAPSRLQRSDSRIALGKNPRHFELDARQLQEPHSFRSDQQLSLREAVA